MCICGNKDKWLTWHSFDEDRLCISCQVCGRDYDFRKLLEFAKDDLEKVLYKHPEIEFEEDAILIA